MKKYKCLMILVLIALLTFQYTSCSADKISKESNATQSEALLPPVAYTVYVDFSAGDQPSLQKESSEVTIRSGSEKNFLFANIDYIEKPENAADSVSISIYNKTYEFSYLDSIQSIPSTETSRFKDRAIINRYKNDIARIELAAGNNKPVFFKLNVKEQVKEGSFTEQEAVEAAKSVIEELYGAGSMEGYSRIQTVDDGETKQRYTIAFEKKIFGYQTNDNVVVCFDMAGNLISFNSFRFGIMNGAEQDLTKEEIENAIAYVEDKFSENWNVNTAYTNVVVDTEGDYYIEVPLSRIVEGKIEAIQLHVNIR